MFIMVVVVVTIIINIILIFVFNRSWYLVFKGLNIFENM
jgi:hypothetical protein